MDFLFYSWTDLNQTLQPTNFSSLFSMDEGETTFHPHPWKKGRKSLQSLDRGQGVGGEEGWRRGLGTMGEATVPPFIFTHQEPCTLCHQASVCSRWRSCSKMIQQCCGRSDCRCPQSGIHPHLNPINHDLFTDWSYKCYFSYFSWTQCKDTTKNKRGTLQE